MGRHDFHIHTFARSLAAGWILLLAGIVTFADFEAEALTTAPIRISAEHHEPDAPSLDVELHRWPRETAGKRRSGS